MDRETVGYVKHWYHLHGAMRTLFVHEFVAGGGFAGTALPPGLLSEGLAMLQALLADLTRTNDRRILTTIDDRVSPKLPPGIEVVRVASDSHGAVFRDLAAEAHEVWIVAPETGDRLAMLSEVARHFGARLVGASPEAIRLASDKLSLSQRMAEAGLPAPPTWPAGAAVTAREEIGFPLVVKPAVGAGCEGVGLARDSAELADALERASMVGAGTIVQQYIDGAAASASILCINGRACPLSLNGQDVHIGRSFSYTGGRVPLGHPLGDEALALACRACELIPGLAGYVGVDLILSASGPFVIEINPRLTTSYVGLRAVTDLNLAKLILEVVELGYLPNELRIERKVQFTTSGDVKAFRG